MTRYNNLIDSFHHLNKQEASDLEPGCHFNIIKMFIEKRAWNYDLRYSLRDGYEASILRAGDFFGLTGTSKINLQDALLEAYIKQLNKDRTVSDGIWTYVPKDIKVKVAVLKAAKFDVSTKYVLGENMSSHIHVPCNLAAYIGEDVGERVIYSCNGMNCAEKPKDFLSLLPDGRLKFIKPE